MRSELVRKVFYRNCKGFRSSTLISDHGAKHIGSQEHADHHLSQGLPFCASHEVDHPSLDLRLCIDFLRDTNTTRHTVQLQQLSSRAIIRSFIVSPKPLHTEG